MSAEFDLSEPIEGTTVAMADLILLGEALLRVAALPQFASHETPCNSTDYAQPGDFHTQLVRDIIRWAGLVDPKDRAPHRARVETFLRDSGWRNLMLAEMGYAPEAAA